MHNTVQENIDFMHVGMLLLATWDVDWQPKLHPCVNMSPLCAHDRPTIIACSFMLCNVMPNFAVIMHACNQILQ